MGSSCGTQTIPTENVKYKNPRIEYDGINWYITVRIEYGDCIVFLANDSIGIDFGVKVLAACSDEKKYGSINKTQKVKKLEKRKHRLQRSISRRYENNKRGGCYCKTGNIIKREKELKKIRD